MSFTGLSVHGLRDPGRCGRATGAALAGRLREFGAGVVAG